MVSPPNPQPLIPENDATTQAEYYRRILEDGVHTLFEQRAMACPMCAASDLIREQTLCDLVLLKPGYFHMSRCRSCGHIFQNPRLNARGLEFYYRDFYTGAGEQVVRRYLGTMTSAYRARARMIAPHHQPRRWLDVGAGYGHFCRTARETWQNTEFHVVDASSSIRKAEELGWATRAYAGFFVDLAPQLEGPYDVVSMFHYLEHTVDPIREIRLAAELIGPGGMMMIEVPDPDSLGRPLLGRYWPSWLAPQHLHLFPARNMQTYLRQAGLEPVAWHRARAHQATDAQFAMDNYLRQQAPAPGVPWNILHSKSSQAGQLLMTLSQVTARLAMKALDLFLSPLRYLPRWPNTYRVLARKKPGSAS